MGDFLQMESYGIYQPTVHKSFNHFKTNGITFVFVFVQNRSKAYPKHPFKVNGDDEGLVVEVVLSVFCSAAITDQNYESLFAHSFNILDKKI